MHSLCLFYPFKVRLFLTGNAESQTFADYKPYVKNNCCLLLSKNLQSLQKTTSTYFQDLRDLLQSEMFFIYCSSLHECQRFKTARFKTSNHFLELKEMLPTSCICTL